MDRAHHIEPLLNCADERVNRAILEGGDRVCVSVLGEAAPHIDEIVLDIPSPPEPMAMPVSSVVPIANVQVPGGDEPVLDMPALVDLPVARAMAAPAQPADVTPLISVDKALQLVVSGQGKLIEPYLKTLMQQLKPLLDLIADRRP